MEAEQQKRWETEAEFFSRVSATERSPRPMDPLAVRRFADGPLRERYQKEYRFRVLGDVTDRRILDVGCGSGVNAVLLAMLGATVVGVDVSADSLEVARARARASGVEGRTRFLCTPAEEIPIEEGPFDVVWCDSILHHITDSLDGVLQRLVRVAGPGSRFIVYEPVSLSVGVRNLRSLLPAWQEVTPDERPLRPDEIDRIAGSLVDPRCSYYSILERFSRFILRGEILERVSPARRLLVDALVRIDRVLLALPGINRVAGRVVIHGRTGDA